MIAALKQVLEEDARRFGIRRRTAWSLFWLAPALTLVFLATAWHRPLFVFLTREDSVLEWSQVLCFTAASLAAARAAMALRRRSAAAAAVVAVLAVGSLVAAGEEVSWGQRLFVWETPEWLVDINHQGETTIHNIDPVQTTLNYVQLVLALYGGVIAVALRSWTTRPLFVDVALPPAFLAPAFLTLFGYRLVRLTVLTEDRFAFVKAGEMPELAFAFAVAATAVSILHSVRQPAGTSVRGSHPVVLVSQAQRGRLDDAPRPVAAQSRRRARGSGGGADHLR